MHLLKGLLACFLLLACLLWLNEKAVGRQPGPGFYCGPYATALPSRLQEDGPESNSSERLFCMEFVCTPRASVGSFQGCTLPLAQ
ncbi:hypothetical protein ILYODFUR_029322 [Ilyodon furcidens]|uniref:Secreted protein n=1 Tax=Ilyodon furcidens TaxID=33524 RepID=A0ABV0TC28_9TELE